jgi:hypothetical protein
MSKLKRPTRTGLHEAPFQESARPPIMDNAPFQTVEPTE